MDGYFGQGRQLLLWGAATSRMLSIGRPWSTALTLAARAGAGTSDASAACVEVFELEDIQKRRRKESTDCKDSKTSINFSTRHSRDSRKCGLGSLGTGGTPEVRGNLRHVEARQRASRRRSAPKAEQRSENDMLPPVMLRGSPTSTVLSRAGPVPPPPGRLKRARVGAPQARYLPRPGTCARTRGLIRALSSASDCSESDRTRPN